MLNLLYKDFKLMFKTDKKLSARIISTIFTVLFVVVFVAIEVFLFTTIINKTSKFKNADMAFLSLFLFILSIMMIISGLVSANKLFFNEKDIEQLSVHPVSNSSIIFSKLVFLFVMHYITSLIFVYPVLIAYGAIMSKGIWFYYVCLFYPILSFIFEIGVALILVYPVWLIKNFLKKRVLLKFILTLICLFIGCYLYSIVLNIFIEFVAGNNINALFTTTSINKLIELEKYQIPINFLIEVFVQRKTMRLFPYIMIALGVFIIGLTITIFAFNYVRNISISNTSKPKEKEFKSVSITKALIKKEITLLTKNSDYTLSFTGLLIVQPFLAFLVIKALNTIFTSGTFMYYVSVVPNFIPLMDILIMMLFTVIISQGASSYIQMEKATIKVMKTIPVKYSKQLFIKVLIPFILSFSSLLITSLVLLIGNMISVTTFIFGLILTSGLLVVFDIVSLKEEVSIRNKKPRSTFLSSLYSYILPIVYFLVCAGMSYFGLSIYIAYLIGFVIFILSAIPIIIYLVKNLNSLFMDLDVVN